MVVHGHFIRHDAYTLEELYEPWVSPATEIASSTDANFSSVVGPRWSAWEAPHWSGAIKPATEKDLQKVVSIVSLYFAYWYIRKTYRNNRSKYQLQTRSHSLQPMVAMVRKSVKPSLLAST
jgi:hypothetical protein